MSTARSPAISSCPACRRFSSAIRDLELHLGEGDRLVDLVREGIDCVLRVGDLQDSGMVVRRVALLEEATCASPAYLARHGTPATPDDLDGHRMIGFVSSATGNFFPLEFTVAGVLRRITLPAAVSVVNAETNVAAARLGLGLIQVPRYHVEADLRAGTLVEVLPDFPPRPDAGLAALPPQPAAVAARPGVHRLADAGVRPPCRRGPITLEHERPPRAAWLMTLRRC